MMDVVVFSSPVDTQIRASRIEAIQQHVARKFGMRVEELNQRTIGKVYPKVESSVSVELPLSLSIAIAICWQASTRKRSSM
jgi:hypothetical protein